MTTTLKSCLLRAIHKEYPDIDLRTFLDSKENKTEININVKKLQEDYQKEIKKEEPKTEPSAYSLLEEISKRVFDV